jgi:hypothetical protein
MKSSHLIYTSLISKETSIPEYTSPKEIKENLRIFINDNK